IEPHHFDHRRRTATGRVRRACHPQDEQLTRPSTGKHTSAGRHLEMELPLARTAPASRDGVLLAAEPAFPAPLTDTHALVIRGPGQQVLAPAAPNTALDGAAIGSLALRR